MSDAPPIISVEDVTLMYGTHAALSHVSVAFPAGATGLLGNNGAGKSTLLQAILGFVEPTSGRIDVCGMDATRGGRDVRRLIGYVPERDATLPEFDAVGSVVFCGQLGGLPRQEAISRAHDVLAYVGLYEVRYRPVENLSTGLRQRLRLAQALINDPMVLLLDEPTNGLDPAGRDRMLDLIWDLGHTASVNVIFSSHLLADIERTCDTCVILDHGRVAARARVGEWNSNAPTVYELRVKGDTEGLRCALASDGIESTSSEEDVLLVTVPRADLSRLFVAAVRVGAHVRHLRRRTQSLEDFFDQTTRRQEQRTRSS